MKFKHNDRVTCEIEGIKITDARISIDKDGTPFICQTERDGEEAENLLGYKYSWRLDEDFKDYDTTDLKLAQEKSFEHPETLEVGDVIVDKSGYDLMILAICGKIFAVSCWNDFSTCSGLLYTFEEGIKKGWKIKPTEEPLEVTQAQVEEKFGRKVKIIK